MIIAFGFNYIVYFVQTYLWSQFYIEKALRNDQDLHSSGFNVLSIKEGKVECLQNAFAKTWWAITALTQWFVHDFPWTFQQPYSASDNS